MASKAEILKTLAYLAAAYPDQGQRIETRVLEMQNAVYIELLADISPEDLAAAAREHVKTSEWFPRVSELRRLAEKIRARKYYAQFEATTQDLLGDGDEGGKEEK